MQTCRLTGQLLGKSLLRIPRLCLRTRRGVVQLVCSQSRTTGIALPLSERSAQATVPVAHLLSWHKKARQAIDKYVRSSQAKPDLTQEELEVTYMSTWTVDYQILWILLVGDFWHPAEGLTMAAGGCGPMRLGTDKRRSLQQRQHRAAAVAGGSAEPVGEAAARQGASPVSDKRCALAPVCACSRAGRTYPAARDRAACGFCTGGK